MNLARGKPRGFGKSENPRQVSLSLSSDQFRYVVSAFSESGKGENSDNRFADNDNDTMPSEETAEGSDAVNPREFA